MRESSRGVARKKLRVRERERQRGVEKRREKVWLLHEEV